jgi:hypothetical protein
MQHPVVDFGQRGELVDNIFEEGAAAIGLSGCAAAKMAFACSSVRRRSSGIAIEAPSVQR